MKYQNVVRAAWPVIFLLGMLFIAPCRSVAQSGAADKMAKVMTDSLAYLQLTDQQTTQASGFNETAAKSIVQLTQKAKQDTTLKGKALFGQVMGVMKQRNASLQKILTPDQLTAYKEHKTERMADMQTKMMTSQLDLTDEQVPQVYAVNLSSTKEMMADMDKLQGSKGKLKKLHAAKELKGDSKDKDEAMKKILSDQQYTAYEQSREQMQAAMKAQMKAKKA